MMEIFSITEKEGHCCINSLPTDKILDYSKLRAFADDKINVTHKLNLVMGSVDKHCGKRRK